MSWTIESVRTASGEPADVFALYADPSTWSAWGTTRRGSAPTGRSSRAGRSSSARTTAGRTPCRIRRLVPDRALELEVGPPMMRIINVYEVEPATGGSRLRHALEVSGPIGCVARWVGLGRFYERLLDREVARVAMIAAETAQARARASRETP